MQYSGQYIVKCSLYYSVNYTVQESVRYIEDKNMPSAVISSYSKAYSPGLQYSVKNIKQYNMQYNV